MSNAELLVIMKAAEDLWKAIEDFETRNSGFISLDNALNRARNDERYKAQFKLFDDIIEVIN